MADAVEALGQHVQQETPDELVRVKPHRLPAARAVDAIVLPTERDAGVVGGNCLFAIEAFSFARSRTTPMSAATSRRSSRAKASGTESLQTLRWREMDSNL